MSNALAEWSKIISFKNHFHGSCELHCMSLTIFLLRIDTSMYKQLKKKSKQNFKLKKKDANTNNPLNNGTPYTIYFVRLTVKE